MSMWAMKMGLTLQQYSRTWDITVIINPLANWTPLVTVTHMVCSLASLSLFFFFLLLSWFCLVAVLLNYSWDFEHLFAVMHSNTGLPSPSPKEQLHSPFAYPNWSAWCRSREPYLTGATLPLLWVEFLPSEKWRCVFSSTNTKTLLTHNLLSGLLLLNWFLPNWFLTNF